MAKFKVPPLFLENPNPLDSVLDKKRYLPTMTCDSVIRRTANEHDTRSIAIPRARNSARGASDDQIELRTTAHRTRADAKHRSRCCCCCRCQRQRIDTVSSRSSTANSERLHYSSGRSESKSFTRNHVVVIYSH